MDSELNELWLRVRLRLKSCGLSLLRSQHLWLTLIGTCEAGTLLTAHMGDFVHSQVFYAAAMTVP
jgi:hypothetical protein